MLLALALKNQLKSQGIVMKRFIFTLAMLFCFPQTEAMADSSNAKVNCHTSHNGYCSYHGKLTRVYLNEDNLLLNYFESSFDASIAIDLGYNVSNTEAASYQMSDNIEFGKLLYSTALTAFLSGKTVSLQMRDVEHGYLQVDRIWINEI